jgi:ParB family chromosome partitioning protein
MALGKGLNSLIGGDASLASARTTIRKQTGANDLVDRVLQLSLSDIHANRSQPRHHFDPKMLDDLVMSIRQHGVLQPIVVTEDPEGGYELIAGERRMRASKLAGKDTIPAIVRSATDQERLELALIENIQRHDLNPVEEARAYRQLMDEFGLTQQQVADQVGKSRPAVANTLRLLDLPDDILSALESGDISAGKARALLSLKSEDEQHDMFQSMIGQHISVRDVEAAVSESKGGTKGSKRRNPNIVSIEKDLETALGTKVRVQESGGRGKITIEFFSGEELQQLISQLTS